MPRKKRSKADREIIKQQRSTNLIIPRAPFTRLVHEIITDVKQNDGQIIVKKDAIEALQTEAESMLVDLFTDANALTQYCKRDTLTTKDISFVRAIKGLK